MFTWMLRSIVHRTIRLYPVDVKVSYLFKASCSIVNIKRAPLIQNVPETPPKQPLLPKEDTIPDNQQESQLKPNNSVKHILEESEHNSSSIKIRSSDSFNPSVTKREQKRKRKRKRKRKSSSKKSILEKGSSL